MRLLIDTNVLVPLTLGEPSQLRDDERAAVQSSDTQAVVSVASLWEIAIKVRLGKLAVGLPLDELPAYFLSIGFEELLVDRYHVLAKLQPEAATRDPFDCLLLAQCQVENMRLVTRDRALAAHPLAWRPA
jgi:PIN domain nuclease of toxin-antitoxin system